MQLGCTASTTTGAVVAPTPPPLDPLAYLPADSYAIAEARVDRILASPYMRIVLARLQEESKDPAVLQGIELLGRVDRLIAGVSESADASVYVLQGPLRLEEIESYVRGGLGAEPVPVEVRGYAALQFDGLLVVELDEKTFTFGPATVLMGETIERGDRRERPAIFANETYQRYAERVGMGQRELAAVALPSESGRARLDGFEVFRFDRMLALAGAADFETSLQAEAFGLYPQATDAEAVTRAMQTKVQTLLRNPMVTLFGLRPLLSALSAEANDSEVRAQVSLDDGTVRELLERFGGVLAGQIQIAFSMRPTPTAKPAP